MSNKDLDLPTQQELLAQFRCDEIASTAFQLFAEAIKQFPPSQGTGKIVPGLGKLMKETINIALGKLLLTAARLLVEARADAINCELFQRVMILPHLDTTLQSTLANVPNSSRNFTLPFTLCSKLNSRTFTNPSCVRTDFLSNPP